MAPSKRGRRGKKKKAADKSASHDSPTTNDEPESTEDVEHESLELAIAATLTEEILIEDFPLDSGEFPSLSNVQLQLGESSSEGETLDFALDDGALDAELQDAVALAAAAVEADDEVMELSLDAVEDLEEGELEVELMDDVEGSDETLALEGQSEEADDAAISLASVPADSAAVTIVSEESEGVPDAGGLTDGLTSSDVEKDGESAERSLRLVIEDDGEAAREALKAMTLQLLKVKQDADATLKAMSAELSEVKSESDRRAAEASASLAALQERLSGQSEELQVLAELEDKFAAQSEELKTLREHKDYVESEHERKSADLDSAREQSVQFQEELARLKAELGNAEAALQTAESEREEAQAQASEAREAAAAAAAAAGAVAGAAATLSTTGGASSAPVSREQGDLGIRLRSGGSLFVCAPPSEALDDFAADVEAAGWSVARGAESTALMAAVKDGADVVLLDTSVANVLQVVGAIEKDG